MRENPSISSSEEAFQKGILSLEAKQYQQAIKLFQTAMDMEKQDAGSKGPRMKYLSFLGLALTLSQGKSEEGYQLCQQAVKRDFFDPDLFCNLGIVCLRTRRKKEAFDAFRKGLALKSRHRRILEELDRVERREKPVFPGLRRGHPMNRFAGQLRHRLRILFNRAPTLNEKA